MVGRNENSMDFASIQTNLKRLGYQVSCFDTAAEASKYLTEQIKGTSVGIGGSITVEQMGVYESLQKENKVYWHWRLADMTADEARENARKAEVYISSVNGIAESGEIVNIDGNCNRVSEIFFGHKKVYLVLGENKIASDYDKALHRARNIAAPMNAARLNRNTPCAVKQDKCYNCASPDRICRGLSVLWEKPSGCDYEVILIHENLGY